MVQKKVIFKRIMSADGKSFAEARSVAFSSEDSEHKITQAVTVNVSSGKSYSSSFSCSSSSSSVSSSTARISVQ